MANKTQHNFTSTELAKWWGSTILILSLLFAVAPLGVIFPVGGWIFLLFGNIGFYFLVAFMMAISTVIIYKGSLIKGYFSWMQIIGFALLMLGVTSLASTIAFRGKELSEVSSIIMANWDKNNAAYYVDGSIGGGYLGYGLYSLFDMIGTEALSWVLSVALIVFGTIMFLFEEIRLVVMMVTSKASHANAINNSKKTAKKNEREAVAPISFKDPLERPQSPFRQDTYPTTNETRVDRYSEQDNPEIISPAPRYNPSNQNIMLSSGLHEAHFGEENIVQENASFAEPVIRDFLNPAELEPIKEATPAPQVVAPAYDRIKEASIQENVIEKPVVEESPTIIPEPTFVEEPQEIEPVYADPLKENPVIITPEPIQLETPTPAPAPMPAPAPAPVPAPAPAPVVEEEEKVPAFQRPREVDPSITKQEKFEALLSTFSPEKRLIVGQLHADLYEELPPYTLPSMDLLNDPKPSDNEDIIKASCEEKKAIINQLFADFKVGARVESYVVGPSITRFNIEKDPTVRVSAITGAISDLSIRLKGTPVRFEEIVMGQSTSGLEIPNAKTTMVTLKEMLEATPQNDEKYKFHIPFGKDVSNHFVTGDIRKFPHMLVAGSTGSGKSIFIHSILMSLIMKTRPEELKLILVDPKRVEMSLYKDLPHLLCPIIKDVTQVKVCLDKLIEEMERRNQIFEAACVTNIEQYNTLYAPSEGLAKLPYMVLVLDEFADAVDVCKNISEPVARLAQKARSAGIHIILTTQRPTVDVVNGRIKANLPTTVALWVRTAVDSNVILGEGGAEALIGHGDMLVNCPDINKFSCIRAQGCYVDPAESLRVCKFIKEQQKTHYDPVFLDLVDHEAEQKAFEAAAAAAAPSKSEIKAGEAANKYDLIKADVMNMEYVSISKIQREYGVGFPRAGKIIKQLQEEGIVATQEPGQETNSKGLKVLIHSPSQLSGSNEGTTEGVKTIPAGWDMPN